MDKGIWFWVIFVFMVVFSGWSQWPLERRTLGGSLVFFILIFLLGLAVFGNPVK